jgi:hypothetical protein
MTTNTIPQIVLDAMTKDFANRSPLARFTQINTVMAWAGNLTIYYILNYEQDTIIDIQVD